MVTDQVERIRQGIRKPSFPRIFIGLFFLGVISLFRAWQKHDPGGAVGAVIAFFVMLPLVAWWLGKSRLDLNR